ncbi:MAG: RDD family protein [Acidimicrobiales bacterium]
MEAAPPGYYPAQGDPPGTVRYWDGIQWSAEPMPPPPGWDPDRRPGDERFATVWVRIGATLIDGFISAAIGLVFLVPYLIDVFEDIDAGGDGTSVELPGATYLLGFVLGVAWMLCVAFLGGSPGKLLLGLRVTLADGTTTPPGLAPAAVRSLPGFAGIIPLIGPLVGVGFAIASLIMVNNDPERRSAYDRIAGTRVVRKRLL